MTEWCHAPIVIILHFWKGNGKRTLSVTPWRERTDLEKQTERGCHPHCTRHRKPSAGICPSETRSLAENCKERKSKYDMKTSCFKQLPSECWDRHSLCADTATLSVGKTGASAPACFSLKSKTLIRTDVSTRVNTQWESTSKRGWKQPANSLRRYGQRLTQSWTNVHGRHGNTVISSWVKAAIQAFLPVVSPLLACEWNCVCPSGPRRRWPAGSGSWSHSDPPRMCQAGCPLQREDTRQISLYSWVTCVTCPSSTFWLTRA